LTFSSSRIGGCGIMLIAFSRASFLFLAGQMSTHNAQPVQSSGATWMVNFNPFQAGSGIPST
jgi:hypothetical protein